LSLAASKSGVDLKRLSIVSDGFDYDQKENAWAPRIRWVETQTGGNLGKAKLPSFVFPILLASLEDV